eukprot:CAMPEP_0117697588 /NCGR_PEP_ID=MMETSP0804-20121206/29318_1 /TAXON_ID=1074897 /ORGANISM="Tetraselmis astigmatica, Strain CCMP880" /LENGTH=359 /DNA_ID=CAMNT_0005511867 /DNA_START=166 /DNA_END=1245 /DNA_ORIENTATION=-
MEVAMPLSLRGTGACLQRAPPSRNPSTVHRAASGSGNYKPSAHRFKPASQWPPGAKSPSRLKLPGGTAGGRAACLCLALLDDIQGDWEDDVGIAIRVSGERARFSDGSGEWPIMTQEADGTLLLRGSEFAGTGSEPRWLFPNGVMRRWSRPVPVFAAADGKAWSEAFHTYKAARLLLRRRLWSSIASEDFAAAAELQREWQSGGPLPAGATDSDAARLAAGRWLVPGVPCLHRRYGYRCVVIGCEPWCRATGSWRQAASLPRGESQPFYHCLVDERDRPGARLQTTFVAEENLDPRPLQAGAFSLAFPLQSRLAERLLVRSDELRGYLPSPRLEAALRAQREVSAAGGLDFTVIPDLLL